MHRIARMRSFVRCALSVSLIGAALLPPLAALRAQESAVVSYDLGTFTIAQTQFEPSSRFYAMPVQMRGLIAVPEGEGPFPVALFLHGSYVFCTAPLNNEADIYPCPEEHDQRQFEGFAYLAQALAERGYIGLIPDTAAEHTLGFGESIFGERNLQIVNTLLDALAAEGDGFGVDLTGKVDLSRLVIASHSRGGPLSILYAIDERANYEVQSLAMLTPAAVIVEAIIPEHMPVGIVISECDGDVGLQGPLFYVNQLSPTRTTLTTLYTLPLGTHNGFSTQLGRDFAPQMYCEDISLDALLPNETQQAFAAEFVPDFFDMALRYGSLDSDR